MSKRSRAIGARPTDNEITRCLGETRARARAPILQAAGQGRRVSALPYATRRALRKAKKGRNGGAPLVTSFRERASMRRPQPMRAPPLRERSPSVWGLLARLVRQLARARRRGLSFLWRSHSFLPPGGATKTARRPPPTRPADGNKRGRRHPSHPITRATIEISTLEAPLAHPFQAQHDLLPGPGLPVAARDGGPLG